MATLMKRFSRLPIFWQIFLSNAAVLIIAGVGLAVSPATVSTPIQPSEAGILAVGLAAMLALNLFLIRRAVAPLERLARDVSEFDPQQLDSYPSRTESGGPEVEQLAEAIRAMATRVVTSRLQTSKYMLYGQEDERRRVARELHDEIGQSLTALMLAIDGVAETAGPETQPRLAELRETARALNAELETIVTRLRPEALDDLGLRSAVVLLTDRFSAQTGIAVTRRIASPLPAMDPDVELVIYRIGQEALTNAARHADASEIAFELEADVESARLRVTDDGRGLGDASPGAGIRGMLERALLISAELKIGAPPSGRGAQIVLDVPSPGLRQR
jgi:two-component system sensor histidine kinase UhpB